MSKPKLPTGTWQVVGQPILPLQTPHDNAGLPVPPGYKRIFGLVPPYVTGKSDELRKEHSSSCPHCLRPSGKKPTGPSKFPLGTLIPLTSLDYKKDFLFMPDWHFHPLPWGWHHGVSAFEPIVDDLKGRWRVEFDTGWSWYYTFNEDKTVRFTDIKDPPQLTGNGTWAYIGNAVKITWPDTSEQWSLPLKPRRVTGKISFLTVGGVCIAMAGGQRGQSLVGQGGLSAEKVS